LLFWIDRTRLEFLQYRASYHLGSCLCRFTLFSILQTNFHAHSIQFILNPNTHHLPRARRRYYHFCTWSYHFQFSYLLKRCLQILLHLLKLIFLDHEEDHSKLLLNTYHQYYIHKSLWFRDLLLVRILSKLLGFQYFYWLQKLH
jgi:hypothetical protein